MVMWPAQSALQWCDSSGFLLVPGPRFRFGWGWFSHYSGRRVSQTWRFGLWRLFTRESLWVACFPCSTDDSLTTQVAFFFFFKCMKLPIWEASHRKNFCLVFKCGNKCGASAASWCFLSAVVHQELVWLLSAGYYFEGENSHRAGR